MQRSIDTPDAPTKLAQLKDSTGLFLEEENTREGLARPGALRRPRRSPRLTVYHAWAVLLSTLAVLVILTKCARSRYILGGKAGDGRQLAGNDGESDEDPDLAAILELCVEMEQEHGQSMQPYGMPPQMYWGDSQPWQHVPGSREDLHTGAQSTSSPEWDGSVPSSSAGTPGFHQGPAMQTDYSFLTRSADILEGNEYLDEGPSTSAGVSTMLLPYADGSLPHQGPGTQTDYSFLRGSADMRGSPESLGEGPSTSAGFSSMLLPSADGSVSSGSAGYGSSALPAAGSAPSSFQGFHVPSSAAPLNVPLVFDEFNAGLMLPQAKPRAQQAAAAHVVQPTPERSAFPAIVEALSAGKRKSEEQPASTPAAPSKKSRASSKRRARKSRMHETTESASLTSTQTKQLLVVETTASASSGSGRRRKRVRIARDFTAQRSLSETDNTHSGVEQRDSLPSSSRRSPARLPSHEASKPEVVDEVHQTSHPPEALRTSTLGAAALIDDLDSSTEERITSATGTIPLTSANGHPFYRVPVLQPGAFARPFSLAAALTHKPYTNSVHFALQFMHSLLVKDMVLHPDLDGFISKMEELAGHLLHFHTKEAMKLLPKDALQPLGLRYLVLDTLFAASQVLGEPGNASPWWKEVVANIPEEDQYDRRRPFGRQFKANVRLLNQLCTAIELLKRGIRPSSGATVLIKKRLFCKQTSPGYFKRSCWDPWRKDNEDYEGGSG